MAITEETFGPVAGIMNFETETEAIRLANNTPYGLAAYVFTVTSTASGDVRGARLRHHRDQHRLHLGGVHRSAG